MYVKNCKYRLHILYTSSEMGFEVELSFFLFFPHVVLKPLRLRHTPGRQSDSTGAACGLDAQILGFTWFYNCLHGFIVLISFD